MRRSTIPTQRFRKTKRGILTNIYSKQVERSRKKGWPMPDYSLSELHEMFIDDKQFDRLWKEWIKSGFEKGKKPSIDRIDCMKPYLKSNIQMMTWAENRYKQRSELAIIRARKIIAHRDGRVIAEYKSVSDAVIKTGFRQSGISACVNGRNQTCNGIRFTYADDIHQNPELLEAPNA